MESSSKKRISVVVHMQNQIKKVINVYLTDKIKSLESVSSSVDFYLHGEKLKIDKTFEEGHVQHQSIIHTSDKARQVFQFDPIQFKFLNGTIIELPVPKVWTFKRAAQVLGASNGIDPKHITLIFQGRKMDQKLAFMDQKNMVKQAAITVVVNGDFPAVS